MMMGMIAAGMPEAGSAAAIGWTVVTLAGVLVIVRNGLGFWRELNRSEPEKREVTIKANLPSRSELDKWLEENKGEHANLFSKIGGVERGAMKRMDDGLEALRVERREDMRSLHEQVNGVGQKVSALEATNHGQSQRLASIEAKLDRMIERRMRDA